MIALQTNPTDAAVQPGKMAGTPIPFELPRPGTIPIPPQPDGITIRIDDGDDDEDEGGDERPVQRPIRRRMPTLN